MHGSVPVVGTHLFQFCLFRILILRSLLRLPLEGLCGELDDVERD